MKKIIAKSLGACTIWCMALGFICVLTLAVPLYILASLAYGVLTFGDMLETCGGWYTDVFQWFIWGIKGL